MRPKTAGERLFLLLRDDVLEALASRQANWANFGQLIDMAGGGDGFADYVRGAMAAFAMRRLLRFWANEVPLVPNEANHVRRISKFVKEEVFPSLDAHSTSMVARAVVNAHSASQADISPGVRKLVLRDRHRLTCYLCAMELNAAAPEGSTNFLTLEHLWPRSIGGDSIEANLLPACTACQKITKDTISWEWLNIHNYVLPPLPSADALKRSVGPKARYARHYLEVLRLCDTEGLTLKESFLKLGPMNDTVGHRVTNLPLTFFDLTTV